MVFRRGLDVQDQAAIKYNKDVGAATGYISVRAQNMVLRQHTLIVLRGTSTATDE